MVPRRTDAVDVEVGKRIKDHRLNAGLTQTALANAIGVTFQQVQKYENGSNRVGAGRLTQVAEALKVPIATLYTGDDWQSKPASVSANSLLSLLRDPNALRLIRAFGRIDEPGLRLSILQTVERVATKAGTYTPPKRRRHGERKV